MKAVLPTRSDSCTKAALVASAAPASCEVRAGVLGEKRAGKQSPPWPWNGVSRSSGRGTGARAGTVPVTAVGHKLKGSWQKSTASCVRSLCGLIFFPFRAYRFICE